MGLKSIILVGAYHGHGPGGHAGQHRVAYRVVDQVELTPRSLERVLVML